MVGVEVLGGLDADAPCDALAGEDASGSETLLRVIADPWSEPTARLALGLRTEARSADLDLSEIRLNPIPARAPARSLEWANFAPQAEIDAWVAGDADACRALRAAFRWMDGQTASLPEAVSDEFEVADLFAALLHDLDGRDWEILRRRLEGETYEEIAAVFRLSRERVRQLLERIDRRVGGRLTAELGNRHPAATALAVHVRRLAWTVVDTASRAEGRLRPKDQERWVRRALGPEDALVLGAIQRSLELLGEEARTALGHLSRAGHPLADGRTTLRWTDADIARLRATLDRIAGERRSVHLAELAEVLGIAQVEAALLARLGGLEVEEGAVAAAGFKMADLRRARAEEILRTSGRALHYAEILLAGLQPPTASDWNGPNLIRAMSEEPGRFANDGEGLWCLASRAQDGLVDLRPACPAPPGALAVEGLVQAHGNAAAAAPGTPALDGLDPEAPRFVVEVAGRVADRLARIPPGQRSVAESLRHPEDLALLRRWLDMPCLDGETTAKAFQDQFADEAALGLALACAALAAWRTPRTGRQTGWIAFRAACGADMRKALFLGKGTLLQRRTTSALVHAVSRYGLRHAFDFRCNPWSTLLGLQAGFAAGSLRRIPAWLDRRHQAPDAVGLLAAPGRNHSGAFELLWRSLGAYWRGELGDEELAALAEASPWWPGWPLAGAFATLRGAVDDAPRPGTAKRMPSEPTADADAAEAPADEADDGGFGEPRVSLDIDAGAFVLAMPGRLDVKPGPVAVCGDGFRIGGTANEDGRVTWHGPSSARLPLRGRHERTIRIEASGELVAEPKLRLWAPDDFITLYDLGSARATAVDPYVALLSTSGPHALVLHPGLTPSVAGDDERELDQGHALHVYRRGVPDGMAVSCEGEVLWEPRRRSDAPRVALEVAPAVLSGDAGDLKWGERCDLRVFGLPEGFIPARAIVGGQRLEMSAEAAPWRFQGYAVLPGGDPLRRKGRIEGRHQGHRAAVPAVVMLRRPARGAVLRNGQAMRPLVETGFIDRTRDADWRLWVFRSQEDADAEHVVFEGVRPAARHGPHGARLSGVLYALGEPLSVAPTLFNRRDRTVQVAAAVLDQGAVAQVSLARGAARVEFRSPLAWTEQHRVRAWGRSGFLDCAVDDVAADGSHVLVRLPSETDTSGLSVQFGAAWLGSAYLAPDPVEAAARLLAGEDFCSLLAEAVTARLPLLGGGPSARATLQTIRHGPEAVQVLLRAAETPERQHLAGQLLARWAPRDDAAARMVREFASALEQPRPPTALLERLAAAAPCTAVRVLRPGLARLARAEQKRLLYALILRVLPPDLPDEIRASLAPSHPDRSAVDAEEALLDLASRATRLDRVFLASRSEASIASHAWAAATAPVPPPHPENLATALALPPVRRWLGVHLLARLVLQGP